MEISLRNRILVGAFATVVIVGSGVATAIVTSSDRPTVGAAIEASAATGDTVDTTVPSTPGATTPGGADQTKADDGDGESTTDVARYWDPVECGGAEAMNHGQYVSSQPKTGEARSTAAQSDCGKPLTSIGDDGDEGEDGDDGDDGDDEEVPDVEAPDAEGARSPSGSPGKSGSAPGHNK